MPDNQKGQEGQDQSRSGMGNQGGTGQSQGQGGQGQRGQDQEQGRLGGGSRRARRNRPHQYSASVADRHDART